jgi:hypothetical protein
VPSQPQRLIARVWAHVRFRCAADVALWDLVG